MPNLNLPTALGFFLMTGEKKCLDEWVAGGGGQQGVADLIWEMDQRYRELLQSISDIAEVLDKFEEGNFKGTFPDEIATILNKINEKEESDEGA